MGDEEGGQVSHGRMADALACVSPPSVLPDRGGVHSAGSARATSQPDAFPYYTRFIRSTAISTRSGVAGASSLGQTL
ncbi:hypothetical protein RHECNPAF_110027 [Rhizobium etli CNPAF512]|nr:hypothetical protein RHECNPAF_110027 [Rhizobium etli CNPAF512]